MHAIARDDWKAFGPWFGTHSFPAESPPDWHVNPFSGSRADSGRNWFELGDFDSKIGDIKTIWEASRFDWLIAMAQRAALGDQEELDRLNRWLADWSSNNPPYKGVNWKCGQEASIRVMHLALAALILDQVCDAQIGLLTLVKTHLARIAPTIGYAIGQQNNHGTSEAVAMYIGGSWLSAVGDAAGELWARLGRKWLEERARSLIATDGTFSQYSLNYHRLMLDTYSLAECWRSQFALAEFSPKLYTKMIAATRWLYQLVDRGTGDGPNMGANDGARLIALTATDYRDFRPSLQLAAKLFLNRRAIAESGSWDQQLIWFGLPVEGPPLPAPESVTFDDGGLHVLRHASAVAYLRYPRFSFRPSQSDILHVDLWHRGVNLLRDGGSYSYAASVEETAYFSGVASHNTVQFGSRDQMPRLGRFLFGRWPKALDVDRVAISPEKVRAGAGYRDHNGCRHFRSLDLQSGILHCHDILYGNAEQAVVRWRLPPRDWKLKNNTLTDGKYRLEFSVESEFFELYINRGLESRYYMSKSIVFSVEIHVKTPASIHTIVRF